MSKEQTRLLTVEEAAEALGLKAPTLRAWMARRRITYVKLGRSTRILASEVNRLIDNGLMPAHNDPR
jgi:excisionase family DNA binding protein